MSQTISSRIKATTAWADPGRYGRSDRSTAARWFWLHAVGQWLDDHLLEEAVDGR